MKQQQLEQTVKDLLLENDALRAELRKKATAAPTVYEVLGPEAFERLVELRPSLRESGTPIRQTDTAAEVLWSCIRMLMRTDARKQRLATSYAALSEDSVRMSNALAEYAMRAVEEDDA